MDRFAADGYDLLLAGHTHGGQLCLPLYGALVTNCGIDRRAGQRPAPAPGRRGQGGPDRALAARVRRPGHLAVGAGPVRLPPGGHPAHAGPADRLDFRRFRVRQPGLAPRRSAGCGAAWQRASFGTKRPPVQIRPPRPEFSQSDGPVPRYWSRVSRSRPLSRDRTRCPRCPASRGTTHCRHRQAVAARVPRRARPAVRIRPQVRPGALHPRARCRSARQDAADS